MPTHLPSELGAAFTAERDRLYSIPLQLCPADAGDSCLGKHFRLKKVFERFEVPVRWAEGSFVWTDLRIPEDILALPHEKTSTHVWLEIFWGDKWHTIDATWDSNLVDILPVNTWEQLGEMKIAVPIHQKFDPEKITISPNPKPEWATELEKEKEFLAAFNAWLEENRLKNLG